MYVYNTTNFKLKFPIKKKILVYTIAARHKEFYVIATNPLYIQFLISGVYTEDGENNKNNITQSAPSRNWQFSFDKHYQISF